eukprot:TRINITY_DN33880_c0_g1_i1.p1 TRINITY_DN33880_c0_g1~~TRINITY_DN33880_c0_g1_i1.p1  ORF type:complete len:287 (-),score=39.70 TRINITY_DN33880_c0_g1_i1:52-912(-)
MACSRCGQDGHRAAACPNLSFYKGAAPAGYKAQATDRVCFRCGGSGHIQAHCPSRKSMQHDIMSKLHDNDGQKLRPDVSEKLDTLQSVYDGLRSGYAIPEEEKQCISDAEGIKAYGEILPAASLALLMAADLRPKDVFVDLGSGTGKVVVLAALCTAVGKAVGIELSETRAAVSLEAIRKAELQGRCAVFAEDFLKAPCLAEATVCYCCNYTFPDESFVQLAARLIAIPGIRFFATLLNPYQRLPADALAQFEQAFVPSGQLRLGMTWDRRVPCYLYRRRGKIGRP